MEQKTINTSTPATHLHPPSQLDGELDILISSLKEGYYEMDENLCYCRVNPAGAAMAGKSIGELLGKSVVDMFPEATEMSIHQTVLNVMADRQPRSITYYYPLSHRWYESTVYPTARGVAIFVRDNNEQKMLEYNLSFLAQASKILSSSLDYKKTLKNVAKLAVPHIADWCTVDILTKSDQLELLALAHVDPKKVTWARQLRRANPVKLDAPTGLPQVLRTGKSQFIPEITEEMIKAAAPTKRQLQLIRQVGFTSFMIVPLIVRGRVAGGITFVSAESGHHYTKADLNMAEELASRAALAIENARLFTESQEAVQLRDDFISIASHELKTPVTSLKVYTEVLQKQASSAGQTSLEKHLKKMNQQVDKLSQLIGDLLNISRIQSGKLEFRNEFHDLNAVVKESVEILQQTSPKHHIDIQGSITKPVYLDKDRINQVIDNLITNATKYSPLADKVIIRLAEQADGVTVSVQDFGIGIDKPHLDKLFDRFYRVNNPEEKTFPGLGIGLYISNIIIQRHHGHMHVESEKGKGSTFTFYLPHSHPGEQA